MTAGPVINSEDKQIWDSKAGEKLVPEAALKQLVPQLYLSLEAFSFFEMDTGWLFLSSKNYTTNCLLAKCSSAQ